MSNLMEMLGKLRHPLIDTLNGNLSPPVANWIGGPHREVRVPPHKSHEPVFPCNAKFTYFKTVGKFQ